MLLLARLLLAPPPCPPPATLAATPPANRLAAPGPGVTLFGALAVDAKFVGTNLR